jgi:processive 1,2-diacylglycerol beta-glucosyltransferase
MKKVLILTASFGLGHNSVAEAIKDQLETFDVECSAEIIDAFEILSPHMKSKYENLYKVLTDKYPKIYNYVYALRQNNEDTVFDQLFYEVYKGKIYKYLEEEQPEMIISTFPMCSGIVAKIKDKLSKETPMITVVTDVVDSWEWLHNETDMYFVPSATVKKKLIEKAVDDKKIRVTGIPVRKEFLVRANDETIKKRILIMASAMNNMGITDETLQKVDELNNLQVILVTGSNKKLYKQLSKNHYRNIEILGFTHDMADLMRASDYIITKPGGVTLFEAINLEVPLIIKDSGIGQEKANVEYVKTNEIGIALDETTNVLELFEDNLVDDSTLKRIKDNIKRIKGEINSTKIAEYSFEMISS